MPDFILDCGSHDDAIRFKTLDSFVQGYIEAAFFTSTGYNEEEGLAGATFAELAPDSLAAIIADCAAWQATNAALLDEAYTHDYAAEQAGRDYWFTRNGHGVGFWSRSELDTDDLGERLSAVCRYSDVYMYRGDDGLIYLD